MTLWMLFAAMLIVALLFVLPPLFRQPRVSGPGQNELNIVLHRKRLVELEVDLANSVLNETQFAQARDDLERELLQELSGAPDSVATVPVKSGSRFSALALAVILPVLALGLYYKLGNWRAVEAASHPAAMTADAAAGTQDATTADGTPTETMPPIEEMIKKLEEKLAKEPGNAQGWLMLGRSYIYTNRYPDAVRAYAQAETLTDPPDAQVLAEYAQALSIASGDRMAGAPERLVEKALKLQPDNPNALWLAGMAAFQKADYKNAVKHWEPLQKFTKADSEQGKMLQDYLSQARSGKPIESIMSSDAEAVPQESTPEQPAAGGASSLKVHVALDPAIAAKAAADDTVFIFARAVTGPPMPLAIVRKQVRDLPVDVVLDDSQAMMPAMKLSNFAEVVVGARISKSGNATPASGDLQNLSDALPTKDAQAVNITIDQVVP